MISLKNAVRKLAVSYGLLDVPLFENFEMEISSVCNLRCSTCPNSRHSRPYQSLPTPVIHRVIAELKSLNYAGNFSPHFFNEPLTDNRLPDILKHARSQLPMAKIVLFTNFTLMTTELYRQLAPAVDSFLVTVDEPAINQRVAAISAQLSPDELDKLHLRSLKHSGLSNRAGAVDLLGESGHRLARCTAAKYMVIDASGEVHLCWNDYFNKAIFGNIHKQSVMEIWRSPAFVGARNQSQRAQHSLCKSCRWSEASL